MVQPADTVYRIADLSEVWLVADVRSRSAGNLAVGQIVEAQIGALPNHTINRRLSFVSSTVNPGDADGAGEDGSAESQAAVL